MNIRFPRTVRFRTTIRRDTVYAILLFPLYLFACWAFFVHFALPSQTGIAGFNVGADSHTYIATAKFYGELDNLRLSDLVRLSSNLFGPVFVILATDYNYLLVFLANTALLLVSVFTFFRYYGVNRILFWMVLIGNPLTIVSLTTVSKEIIGLCGILYLLVFWRSKSWWHLGLAFLLSFFTRWQQVAFLLVLIPYVVVLYRHAKFQFWLPVISLLAASLLYPFLAPFIEFTGDDKLANVRSQYVAAGGILPVLNSLQNNFLYWLVFVPKALLNYVGNLPRITTLFTEDFIRNFYNQLLLGHQSIMFILLIYISAKRSFKLKYVETHTLLLYTIIYCIGLTINYRYFYPVYPIFILLALSGPTEITGSAGRRLAFVLFRRSQAVIR